MARKTLALTRRTKAVVPPAASAAPAPKTEVPKRAPYVNPNDQTELDRRKADSK